MSHSVAPVVAGTTQACCEFGGICNDRTEFDCANAGGTPQGAGTMCLGDANSNGVDDACDTQACCGVGKTGCEDRPPASCGGKEGGTPQGPGTMCAGDGNENGTDDACEGGGTFDAVWVGTIGAYATPGLWDIAMIPCNSGGDGYNVTIAAPGAAVTLSGSACGVDTLTLGTGSTLNVVGGAGYSVADGGALHGTLAVDGASFACNSATDFDDASLTTTAGTLSILGASSYARHASADGDADVFSASGGVLDLTAVGSITQSQSGSPVNAALHIAATSGGTVDLAGVSTILGGATQITASGASSQVNLTTLTTLTDTNAGTASSIHATAGGDINTPNLTTLDGVDWVIDGTGTQDTAQIASFRNATFALSGGTANLSNATDVSGSEFVVTSGSDLSAGAVSYSRNASTDGDSRRFSAHGANSELQFPALTTITQTQSIAATDAALEITSANSGTVGFPSLTSLIGGATQVSADGIASVVDLSQLNVWTVSNPATQSFLHATNGGVIQLGSLSSISGVNLTLDATSRIATGSLTLNNGALDYGGGEIGPAVVRVNDGTLVLRQGSPASFTQFRLSGISSYSGWVRPNVAVTLSNESSAETVVTTVTDFKVFGVFAIQPIGAITLITPGGWVDNRPGGTLEIGAGQGGPIHFRGGLLNSGDCRISSTLSDVHVGTDGVDLFNDGHMEIRTLPGSKIVFEGSLLENDGELIAGGSIEVAGLIAFVNEGTLGIHDLYTASPTTTLAINGGLTQLATGTMEFDIAGSVAGDDFDAVQATGTVSLAGTLAITLLNGFDPPANTAYEIISGSAVVGEFDTTNLPALPAPLCLDVVYAADSVRVVATVPGIAADPQDTAVCEGAVAQFSVAPAGIGNITYQWRKGGVVLPGANAATLVLDPVSLADAGDYDVIVTSACGADTSGFATLTVVSAPLGDLNADCEVNLLDVPPMVDCMTGPGGGVLPGCTPADLEADVDVDLRDYALLQELVQANALSAAAFVDCLTGPGGGVLPGCLRADLDVDIDVDLRDFAMFQALGLPSR